MTRDIGRAPIVGASVALLAIASLSGCTTFGGNVKGSFSCAAPDGICAPSSSIDDRALAMIAGEGASTLPAGPVPAARGTRTTRTVAGGQRLPVGRVDPRRTQERVLRIVFQPYIDERGRLHEASAVHAVVESGEWQQQALADVAPIPDRSLSAAVPGTNSLADAIDHADLARASAIDPNLPDPAVVAAARARRVDPVQAIQNDVAARLAPTARRTPVPPAPAPSASPTGRQGERGSPPVTAHAPVAVVGSTGSQPAPTPGVVPPAGKTSAADALARMKVAPEYQARAAHAQEDARAAAAGAGALPAEAAKAKATVRAAGFPAAVPEEK